MKIALGTVQFGLDYGVTGGGRVKPDEVARILALASSAGIDTMDTAAAYGTSEAVLGEVGVRGWKVISKLPPTLDQNADAGAWVVREIRASLNRLREDYLEGLLLHRPEQLFGANGPALVDALLRVREGGLVRNIGFSIYSPDELDLLCPIIRPDIVQGPYNAIDRRIETSGWLDRLAEWGSEFHARSLFLQGVLLLDADKRPPYFSRWRRELARFDTWANAQKGGKVGACLRFVTANPAVTRAVVGVDSAEQLAGILAVARGPLSPAPNEIESESLDLLLPSRWG